MTTRPALLVVGNAVLDILLTVDRHPREDEEMRAVARRTDLGGNAANTARVLAELGYPVSLLATLAPDGEALDLRRLLVEAGVGVDHLVVAPAGTTPVSLILVNAANGARTIVHHRDLAELRCAAFAALPLDRYDWVHFEGRNVAEVAAMLAHLRAAGFAGRVSVEIEKPRPGIETLAGQADLVLFSRPYAEAQGHGDAASLLAARRGVAPRAVLTCTWGAAGAWALDPGGRLDHCPACSPARVVDSVGAGDVFNAGMIAGLAADMPVAAALAAATRLAGRKVGQSGFAGLAWPQAADAS